MKTFITKFPLFFTFLFIISCNKGISEKNTEKTSETDTILQKDGTVLSYKTYVKPLIKMKRDRTIYSENYQKRIAKLVEYYFDKSTLPNVKYQLENPKSKLGYSVEETDWEGVNYTQIGLFNRPEKNIKTFQWLFYEPKSQKIYEFDVPKNKPILLEYK